MLTAPVTVTFTPTVAVPNLNGQTPEQVNATMAGVPLSLTSNPAAPGAGQLVTDQAPPAGTDVVEGTNVTATFT